MFLRDKLSKTKTTSLLHRLLEILREVSVSLQCVASQVFHLDIVSIIIVITTTIIFRDFVFFFLRGLAYLASNMLNVTVFQFQFLLCSKF